MSHPTSAIRPIAAIITLLITAALVFGARAGYVVGPVLIATLTATAVSFSFLTTRMQSSLNANKRYTLLVIILPLLWALHSVTAYFHPGDEYMFYVVGSWPGLPITLLGFKFPSFLAAIAIAIVGLIPMSAMGYTLYRSNVRLRGYAYAAAAAFIVALIGFAAYPLQHGGIPRLTAKHGSLLAYYLVAFNVSLIVQAPGVMLSLFFEFKAAVTPQPIPAS